jgi:carbon-monoxide dehydrogenase medium subunit
MYPSGFTYHRARSLDEAVRLLADLPDGAKVLAGGQTLIPLLKLRLVTPAHLVDIGRIDDAARIRTIDSTLRIGALARHGDIAAHAASAVLPIVVECATGLADPQVRSMGTIGGSLAEADPCSCWPALLCTLGASIQCIGPDGARQLTVRELLREPFAPALRRAELIQHVDIPLPQAPSSGSFVAFKRGASSYPTASCAVQLTWNGDTCRDGSIGFGCLGLTPIVADAAAAALRGSALDPDSIDAIATMAADATDPVTDVKGSAAYKRSLAAGLARRALATAVARHRKAARVAISHRYYGA